MTTDFETLTTQHNLLSELRLGEKERIILSGAKKISPELYKPVKETLLGVGSDAKILKAFLMLGFDTGVISKNSRQRLKGSKTFVTTIVIGGKKVILTTNK